MYISIKEAIEGCKNRDYIIPSEFLSTFPNNFGINLCAIRGFNVEQTDNGQLKKLTIDFIPVPEKKLEEPHIYVLEDGYGNPVLVKSQFDLNEDQLNDFMNEGIDEDEQDYYDLRGKVSIKDIKEFT